MKTRWMKKSLSLLLALVLCLSVLSPAALAAEDVVLPEEQSEPAADPQIEVPDPVPAEPEAQPEELTPVVGEADTAEDESAPADAEEPGEEPEAPAPTPEAPVPTPEEPEALPEEGEADDEALPEEEDTEETDEAKEPVELRSFSLSYINPLYADVVSEADLPTPRDLEHYRTTLRDSMGKKAAAEEEPITYCQTREEASASFRAQFVARRAEIAVYYAVPSTVDWGTEIDAIFDGAMAHTGNPREGDYLSYQYGGWNMDMEFTDWNETTYYCCLIFTPLYYTSAAQESEMDGRVSAILGQLNLGGKSDRQKLEAIYAYLTANIVYDFDNLNNNDYKLQYTGYAALCNGTAVCQGISVAFYRLCLASGVDARVISCDDMCHAWNIARCRGAYYALDATWDLGAKRPADYWYFLKGSTYWLSRHKAGSVSSLGDQYQDAAFASLYAIPAEDCNLDEDEPDPTPTEPTTPAAIIASGECGATGDNVTWTLDEAGTLIISGSGNMADYRNWGDNLSPWASEKDTIKCVVIEDGVTSIGNYSLYNCNNLTTAEIPEGMTSIGEGSFCGCDSLSCIILPEGTTSIGRNAFYFCSALTSILIPDSVISIGEKAFDGCRLTSIAISSNLTSIGAGAFIYNPLTEIQVDVNNPNYCSVDGVLFSKDMTELCCFPARKQVEYGEYNIPDCVTSIGNDAFYSCSELKNIVLPEGLTQIGSFAFAFCSRLSSMSIPKGVEKIETYVFGGCENLSSVAIPDTVTSIGSSAFTFCDVLKSITIPASVTSIGHYAFSNCSALSDVRFEGAAPSIAANAFNGVTATVYYPPIYMSWAEDVRQNYAGTLTWVPYGPIAIGECGANGDNVNWALDSDGTLTISGTGDMADYNESDAPWYSYAQNIKTVVIQSGVTRIGHFAFSGCNQLANITIPESVTGIGTFAFSACTQLTSILIPEGVTYLGSEAFSASGLTSVALPASLTTLSFGLFEYCYGLESISIPAWVTEIGDRAFYSSGLKNISIPDTVIRIGSQAFRGCPITSISIPDSVTEIGEGAFRGCSNLTSINLPSSLTNISSSVFEGCTGLTSVSIPSSVSTIGSRSFANCTNLLDIYFIHGREGLLSIEEEAFLLEGTIEPVPTNVYALFSALTPINAGISDYNWTTSKRAVTFLSTATQYHIDYILNDGVNSLENPSGYTSLESITLADPSREGYLFMGWYENAEFSGEAVTTLDGGEPAAVYAKWEPIVYAVRFDPNGGSGSMADLSDCRTDESYPLPTCEFTWKAHFFIGWNTMPDESGMMYQPDSSIINLCSEHNGVVTLYAIWSSEAPIFGTYEQMTYRLLAGEITITGCESSLSGEVTIPTSINGYPVVAIADRAFSNANYITGLTLSEGIQHIGNYAFSSLWLENVSIPSSVESIGLHAFSGRGLKSISVGAENAFFSSKDGILFNKDKTILLLCPSGYSGAYTSMPASVITIEDEAFSNCSYLTGIVIPEGVKNIGRAAFSSCSNLTRISLPEGVTEIKDQTFNLCISLTKVAIPSSITSIGEDAFRGTGLTYVAIPRSVQKIGRYAFLGCNNLIDIFFEHGKDDSLYIEDFSVFYLSTDYAKIATTVYVPNTNLGVINSAISNYDWDRSWRDVTFVSAQVQYFHIAYNLNGGTNNTANLTSYTSLEPISLAAPTREGYAFAGWYASEDFSGDPVAVLSGGVPAVLYAKWSPIEYSIHFDPNGGSGTIPDLHGCETDARYPLPESGFARTGYSLAGWNTAPDGSGAAYLPGEEVVNLCSVPDGSVTLYAVWTPNPYTIAFDGNGADGEAMAPMETLFGQSTALPSCTLSRTGYHFTGWNTRADGKGTAYADGAAVLSLTAEAGGVATLYAQWSPNAYTVRFDPNGGTGSMAAQPMTYDKEAALRANAFKKASNVFLGWATEPDALSPLYLDKQKVSNLTAAQDGALTLYAVWAKYSYQIVFNANGGSGDMADDGGFCEYDGVYTLPACGFTREGFDFLGWATSAKGKVVYQDGQSISGLSSKNGTVIKLYAVWQAHSYRVAFDGNGAGSGSMKVLSCTCGKTYTLTANAFKRTGYTFAGWNTAPDGSGATYANKAKQMNFATDNGALLTLYAQWTPTAYKITYKNIVAGDGNPNPETFTVESETIVLAPAFRPGCDFAGWFTDAKFKTPVTEIAAGGTGARTLYAKWVGTANTYGIVFDPNGGTGTTKAMAKLSCGKAYALTANAFKRAGYTFAGWNTDPDGSGTAYANKEKVANLCEIDGGRVTLFAQWTPVVYKITYKNALYDGNTNPETFTAESETIVLAPVSRAGCVFGGWFTDAKFKAPITEIATGRVGNLTLYAKWTGKAATYAIAFDGNGASSGKMKDMTKRACGSAYALTANAFKRTGYSFAGWNTAPDGSGTAFANKEKVANLCEIDGGTATLYVQWTPIAYTISYKNIGPALTPEKTSYTVEEGFELPTPVKVGHVFLGWYSTAAFKPGTQVQRIEPGTTGNLTLYAKWMLLRG